GNTISNSAANEGISIDTLGNAAVTAFVTGNAISLSGAATDFRTAIAVASTATVCLELSGNVNATTNSTFRVDNNSGVVGAFRFFEGANDTLATRLPPGSITDVAQGACGIPPVP
ncbi:MAG: hypothetical protein HZA16_13730, partial [Nitrospirae bacterium]|nr:hypothetical protein [Nitrospirota bacterium]